MPVPHASNASTQQHREQPANPAREQPRQPASPSVHGSLLSLQRAAGNRAVTQLLAGAVPAGPLQPRLVVGPPGDRFEQEADRVADAVVRRPAPPQRNGQPASNPAGQDASQGGGPVRRQPLEEEERHAQGMSRRQPLEGNAGLLQAKETPGQAPQGGPDLAGRIDAMRGQGKPLSASDRAFFEPRFGHEFSRVRIHTGEQATASALTLNARAYTFGRDIVFGAGQHQPHSRAGKMLLAHELAHTLQASNGPPVIRRKTLDKEDPERFEKIHEALFVKAPGGGARKTWKNATAKDPGTAGLIKKQFRDFLKALGKKNPGAFLGTITPKTSEADAEADAKVVDQRLRTQYPQITKKVSEAELEKAVGLLTSAKTSDKDFLEQWLLNKLVGKTDLEEFNIAVTDARVKKVVTDLLKDTAVLFKGKTTKELIRILASRQSAFIETSATSRRIFLHPGISANKRKGTLAHEITHFYVHPGFKKWVDSTTSSDFFEEGFTEYLSRFIMSKKELATRGSYQQRWQAIEDKVAKFVSDDDIARAYFKGEVWRLEGKSDVARELFQKQVGLEEGAPRSDEVKQSRKGPGINQEVASGTHYRFMNLGVDQAAPKPEHTAFFKKIYAKYGAGKSVRLRFVGHASAPGASSHNEALSRRRAAAFYDMARDAGVPESQLVDAKPPPHHGEEKPTAKNESVHGRAFNRRVELFIVAK